ncbi:MAG: hypothetical protein JHC31_07955 [Sulfurihydrogenibium sp.]|jgi:hypothetical protein|nr:hypothetical protein [Sulfurihydrogenibium sp.]
MKMQNTTQKTYYLVFQKVLEFKKFCGIATSREEAFNLKRLLENEKPQEKFLVVKLKNQEVKHI